MVYSVVKAAIGTLLMFVPLPIASLVVVELSLAEAAAVVVDELLSVAM